MICLRLSVAVAIHMAVLGTLLANEPHSNPEPRPRPVRPEHRPLAGGGNFGARLHQLAEEVERAGLRDEAAAIRELAERVQHRTQEQLQAKRRRLEELETEAQRLREELSTLGGLTGHPVQVRVQLLEMPVELAAKLKMEHNKDSSSTLGLPPTGVASRHPLQQQIDVLASKDQLKRLAEPTLIVQAGHAGEFHSGGEFPIFVPRGDGEKSIQYRPFGQRLRVQPESIGDGVWRLDLVIESSERDFSNMVTSEGVAIPGMTSRRVASRVDVHEEGQAAVIFSPQYKRLPEPLSAKPRPVREADQQEVCLVTIVTVDPVREPDILRPIPTY